MADFKMATIWLFICCLIPLSLAADKRNIMSYLEQDGFSQFADFIKVTGLLQFLSSTGPYTVFAPTDQAVAKLPPSMLTSLFSNLTLLEEVLKSHVTTDILVGPLLTNEKQFLALSGEKIRVNKYYNGVLSVEGSQLIGGDVVVQNGVIQVIDRVIIPSHISTGDYLATHDTDFRDLFASLVLTDLFDTVDHTDPITIFAPTDKAFEHIRETLPHLINDQHHLTEIMKYHVVSGTEYSIGLYNGKNLTSLQATDLKISINSTGIMVNNALVLESDIDTLNGVVHIIDTILLPPNLLPSSLK